MQWEKKTLEEKISWTFVQRKKTTMTLFVKNHILRTDFWASSTSFQEAVSVSDSKGPNHEEQESESRKEGFANWKKLSDKLPEHENSQYHKKTFVSWKALETSLGKGGIDKELQDQIKRRNPTGEKYYAVY
ncbi:hypothetical protein J6590_073201 [Homalodisca vitripennis]|nr:hypothetical protein J6590_073201 [Homalodisca vitripennis]